MLPTRDDPPPPYDSDDEFIKYEPDSSAAANTSPTKRPAARHRIYWGVVGVSMLGFLASALCFEPGRPYGHILTTLPLSLLTMFDMGHMLLSEGCHDTSWPLPDLVTNLLWERPSGNFKGWAPGTNNEYIRQYRNSVPDWLPKDVPRGFARWDPESKTADETSTAVVTPSAAVTAKCEQPEFAGDHFYNPVSDPLKITNLDDDVLSELRGALKLDSVNVKHVIIFQMESMRQELFPLVSGSDFHKMVLQSHHDTKTHDEVNRHLAELTTNVQKLTGRPGNFVTSDNKPISTESTAWTDTTEPGFGGLNVVGTHTTCTSSIKSLGAIHCGVWPMPVDSCEESQLESYQPCLPRVLQMFNDLKKDQSTAKPDDFRNQPWSSAFFQSIADEFDNQDDMDRMIGFDHVVTRKQVDERMQKEGTDEEEINYFGFAETAIKQNIKDYITNSTADNKRMFMSHFTSTTHHPWGTPEWFNRTDYLGESTGGLTSSHEDLNNYLNAVHFNDVWVGQVMQLLEDLGVANETLVVFVGDHGQAFREDAHISGTYQNGHISNFRVPLVFHHQLMPRVQLSLNSSSINILPTVLDLLISTDSLNEKDMAAASDIVQDYEGQSLIRPFKAIHHGRRSWNFGIVNPGARFLAVTSADEPYRLVMPWDGSSEFVFTNLATDVLELEGMSNWSLRGLIADVERLLGPEAAQWVHEANAVAKWWGPERKRLWQYKDD